MTGNCSYLADRVLGHSIQAIFPIIEASLRAERTLEGYAEAFEDERVDTFLGRHPWGASPGWRSRLSLVAHWQERGRTRRSLSPYSPDRWRARYRSPFVQAMNPERTSLAVAENGTQTPRVIPWDPAAHKGRNLAIPDGVFDGA